MHPLNAIIRLISQKGGESMTRDKSFYTSFFKIMILLSLQNLIVLSVGLLDNVMLGDFSEAALSGVSIANQIQFIYQNIISAIGIGVVLFSSQYWGKQKALGQTKSTTQEMDRCRDAASIGIFICLLSAVLFFIVVSLIPEQLMALFTDDPTYIEEGIKYLGIIRFSYFAFALSNTIFAALRSVEVVVIGTIASAVTLGTNGFLNYLLIFGNFGAPRLGTEGAAAATLIARTVELCIALIFSIFFDKRLCYFKHRFHLNQTMLKDYIKTTYPVFLSNGLWGIFCAVHTGILGHLGNQAITANSISNALYQMIFVFTECTATSTSIIIGKTIGAGLTDKLREYVKTFQILFLFIGAAGGILMFALCDPMLALYSEISPESLALTRKFILILAASYFASAYQMPCNCGIVRGGGDTKFVLIMDLVLCWGYAIPIALLGAFVWDLSPALVFFLTKSDQFIKCIVAFVKTNRFHWMKYLIQE